MDDEEPIAEITSMMLGVAGYRCRSALGGQDALKLLDSGESFDLIISDLMNAPMDGITFVALLKQKYPDIPVLISTAVHDVSASLAALRNGAYDYLLKPWEREQLYFAVSRALEYRRLKIENTRLRTKIAKLSKRPIRSKRH